MVYSVVPPNPFIVVYNGILGFFSGLFYLVVRRRLRHVLAAQLVAVVAAYIVQAPFVWFLNIWVVGIPAVVVVVILVKLLFEDVVSTLVNHPVLYRVDLAKRDRR